MMVRPFFSSAAYEGGFSLSFWLFLFGIEIVFLWTFARVGIRISQNPFAARRSFTGFTQPTACGIDIKRCALFYPVSLCLYMDICSHKWYAEGKHSWSYGGSVQFLAAHRYTCRQCQWKAARNGEKYAALENKVGSCACLDIDALRTSRVSQNNAIVLLYHVQGWFLRPLPQSPSPRPWRVR
jgi:hypothetical protein